MANTRSARKAVRKILRKTEINKIRRNRTRTFVRKVEEAIASGNKALANAALKVAEPELRRCAKTGIMHKNTAARKVSRLSKRIGVMPA